MFSFGAPRRNIIDAGKLVSSRNKNKAKNKRFVKFIIFFYDLRATSGTVLLREAAKKFFYFWPDH